MERHRKVALFAEGAVIATILVLFSVGFFRMSDLSSALAFLLVGSGASIFYYGWGDKLAPRMEQLQIPQSKSSDKLVFYREKFPSAFNLWDTVPERMSLKESGGYFMLLMDEVDRDTGANHLRVIDAASIFDSQSVKEHGKEADEKEKLGTEIEAYFRAQLMKRVRQSQTPTDRSSPSPSDTPKQ